MSSLDVLENDTIDTVCRNCRTLFYHVPKYVNGDPRNIGYIAHWDGVSPFGTSGGHSTGAIDVNVGNMCKNKKNRANQGFVVGFVRCFKTQDELQSFWILPLSHWLMEL